MKKDIWEKVLERDDWLNHPFTQGYRSVLKKECAGLTKEFLAIAARSSDPAVVRAYERYAAANERHRLFTVQGKDNDEGF